MKSTSTLFLASLLALAALDCNRGAAPAAASPAAPAPTTAATTQAQAPAVEMATGPVMETTDASNYTYIRIKTPKGDVWAAGPTTKVAVGEKVSVSMGMLMANFHSASLNKTFPTIYFTGHIYKEGELPASK